jgi:carbamate kinase
VTSSRRVVIALGGNAMTGPDGSATPGAQQAAITGACAHVAEVVATGVEVVLTHGNGPQVGNLLVKNELAAHEVPPVPLDWCVAQTQATIGFTLADELDAALAARGLPQRTASLVTRTLVDADDPNFREPSKPVGRFLPREKAETFVAHGAARCAAWRRSSTRTSPPRCWPPSWAPTPW